MAVEYKGQRDLIKFIRDRAKSRYNKGTECEICAETENLDFHHFYSMTPLLQKWMRQKGYKAEQVVDFRDEFITEHSKEIYEETVTLCHEHHLKLHSIYGKNPNLGTAQKQKRWVGIQRDKHGLVQ